MSDVIQEMVDRFLSWPLPQTVCVDHCATDRTYPARRYGTNLLTADEARQMIEYLLADGDGELSSDDQARIDAAWGKHKAAAPSPDSEGATA